MYSHATSVTRTCDLCSSVAGGAQPPPIWIL